MGDTIRIQLMGTFTIYINERQAEHMVNKSRKGVALMQYLILNRDQPVPNARLFSHFWQDERVTNPENALKTLISRMRTMLSQISPELGGCIVADRGAYHWENMPGMTVDVYELEDIFEQLDKERADEERRRVLYRRMMLVYGGDLLKNSEFNSWAFARATTLHNQYLSAVNGYLQLLKGTHEDREIVSVCRQALDVDPFDDHLHIELMTALLRCNCLGEAKAQYDEVMHLHYHYLNVEPSEEIKEFYEQVVKANSTIEFNIDSVCKDLLEGSRQHGAFVCEYPVFKEIFNIQVRNIERLGSTMFLAILMVSKLNGQPMDSMRQSGVMQGLLEILRQNLRKGDIVTHYSPTMIAVLLPTVNYTTGDIVIERIKQKFYKKYPNSNILLNYRIAPLTRDISAPEQNPPEEEK